MIIVACVVVLKCECFLESVSKKCIAKLRKCMRFCLVEYTTVKLKPSLKITELYDKCAKKTKRNAKFSEANTHKSEVHTYTHTQNTKKRRNLDVVQ